MNSQAAKYNIILAALLIVTALSMLSGFHTSTVPFEVAWQFSPLGLLQGIRPEYQDLETGSYFSGIFGFTFDYAHVFLKTCVFELPLYWLAFRYLKLSTVLTILFTANVITHPAVFFVIPGFFDKYLHAALFSEVFAATMEMAIAWTLLSYWDKIFSLRERALGTLLVLGANLFSWEMGMFF